MIDTFKPLFASALITAFTSFLAAAPTYAAETQYPLTLKNCGRDIVFNKAPARAVSIGQSSTEILYLLGLGDRLAGTAVWFGPVMKGFEEQNSKVPRLADNDPSFESVVGMKPEIVTVEFQWHVGPKGSVGTPEQFAELGIPVYTSPADCVDKDNSGGGDGTRTADFSMELIYREVRDLAAIFNVQDRGEAVVADLKKREAAARERVASANGKVSAVFWFSSPQMAADPYVAGQKGAPAYILSALGVRNVIESDEEWPTVGWEKIARANPSVIVAATMERRRFPADDIAAKRQFLKSDPVVSLIPAVQQGHVVEMDAQAMNPSIRTIEGIEALSKAIAEQGLAH